MKENIIDLRACLEMEHGVDIHRMEQISMDSYELITSLPSEGIESFYAVVMSGARKPFLNEIVKYRGKRVAIIIFGAQICSFNKESVEFCD